MAQSQTFFAQAASVHYDQSFMEWEKQLLIMSQFAQKRPLPGGKGTVAHFKGYRPFELVTSALTEGTAPTTHGAFEVRDIQATVAEWGSTAKMSKLLELTKLDRGLMANIELVADQAGRSLDYQTTREVVRNGIWGITASGAATDTITVTVASSASNSTSVFIATTHNSNDLSWVGAVVTTKADSTTVGATRTTKYGYGGRVLTWTSADSGDKWTLNTTAPHAAALETFQSGDTVRVVGQRRLAATNVLTTALMRQAQRDLKKARATPFGQYFVGILNPDTTADAMNDTTWVGAQQYSNINQLWLGEVGRWFGFRIMETTLPGREDTDGTENVNSGAVFQNLFIGRNAFGETDLEGGANSQLIYVNNQPDKTDPLNQYSIVGWKQYFARKALNARWAVSIMTGATA